MGKAVLIYKGWSLLVVQQLHLSQIRLLSLFGKLLIVKKHPEITFPEKPQWTCQPSPRGLQE